MRGGNSRADRGVEDEVAGVGVWRERERERRFWRVADCGVKEDRGNVKFTGKAQWIMWVRLV